MVGKSTPSIEEGIGSGDPVGIHGLQMDLRPVQQHITDERKNKNRIILLHVRRATRLRANGQTGPTHERREKDGAAGEVGQQQQQPDGQQQPHDFM